MTECGICGKRESKLIAIVEGVMLTVCNDCAHYGKVLKIKELEEQKETRVTKKISYPESDEVIVKDYSERIKKAREDMHLKQEELARRLAEKESVIHHIESGNFVPSLALARKLEKCLGITLVEIPQLEREKQHINFRDDALTIGDLLKKK